MTTLGILDEIKRGGPGSGSSLFKTPRRQLYGERFPKRTQVFFIDIYAMAFGEKIHIMCRVDIISKGDFFERSYLSNMDGAKPLSVLFRIIIPLSTPALLVVGIFSFIAVWNDFLGPLIYLSDDHKFTLAMGLASFRGLYNAQWGYLMAASTVMIAPIIVIFFSRSVISSKVLR